MSRILHLNRERPLQDEKADVCIVGAGAAGILLALELLAQGKKVTLLEAGGPEVEAAAQEPYQSEVVGHVHRGVQSGRFRALGGTTTRWGGQILELDEEDFSKRPGVAGSGWPFAKAELRRHYARALELEGLGHTIGPDAEVFERLGQPVPSFEGLDPYFTRWCPEPNFAVLHRQTLESHPCLDLWLHANAVELLLDGERAIGVRCRSPEGTDATFAANEYVFCLGAIESSRFFLQPRPGSLPWNVSGLLGRHFQDHIDAHAAEVFPKHLDRFHNLFDNAFFDGVKYQPKLRLTHSEQVELCTLNVAGTMTFNSTHEEEVYAVKATARRLLRRQFSTIKGRELTALARHLPLLLHQGYSYAVRHRAYNVPDARITLRVHCEQEPLGQSSITLAESRDSFGLLRTRLDWRISDRELESILRFAEIAVDALRGLAELRPDQDLMLSSKAFLARCDDSNHHMGGMRMAPSEREGVVSPELLLHGTRNVYVCSAAVFPTSGFSNPTHTLLALAVRLAEHLR